ncbi:hypothetical protein AXG93_3671s1170 [Marchantia polymorpha subsp. ruderalis]|uniref:Uncharacterized protein n=1 Tax=Marchantia polymorpha subsp. ruderalis TaxID=1480154 RepID=A0A176WGM6_MARPO|nr:hypothetical protein AXG93_3671s1170 [Marchantia polymorpha subsp. ruderalis]
MPKVLGSTRAFHEDIVQLTWSRGADVRTNKENQRWRGRSSHMPCECLRLGYRLAIEELIVVIDPYEDGTPAVGLELDEQDHRDDGDLTFNSESVRVTRDEEKAYVELFKHPRIGKNGYRTVWYRDRKRRNIAMALMQILRLSRPTYMMTWQVGFIERALREDRIHWARIFWIATRQHIGEIPGGFLAYLSPFLINFYRGMNLLTAEENSAFPLRNIAQEGEEVMRANEVDSDLEGEQCISPP